MAALFEKIREYTERLEVLARHAIDPSLRRIVVDILATVLQILALCAKRANDGRFSTSLRYPLILIKKLIHSRDVRLRLDWRLKS
jgi:hypothetical protein